jgi:hypothetical protein
VNRLGLLVFLASVALVVIGFLWFRRQRISANQANEITLDPKTLLFSVPTISDDFPATVQEHSRVTGDVVHIHEDDWRQIEFIESASLPEIDREMAEIDAFRSKNHVGLGWKNVYVRRARPNGLLQSGLHLGLIDSIPHGPIQELLIGSQGHESIVEGGFAVGLGPSLFIWGREMHGTLVNLGLNRVPDDSESAAYRNLLAICKKFRLVIVDWCAGRVFPPRINSQTID